MMNIKHIIQIALIIPAGLMSCDNGEPEFDASGAFEADETIISAEASGKLLAFAVDEGQELRADTYLGYIDTVQLSLSIRQLEAQIDAVLSRRPDIAAQLSALNEQLRVAEIEQKRVEQLLNADAATPKQKDDVDGQIDVIKGNITALRTSLITNTQSLEMEIGPLEAQIDQLKDKIKKSIIINPINGTVLTVFAEPFEHVGMGMPLYKIADLSSLTLRAYITGDQLTQLKLNDRVEVLTDDGSGGYTSTTGTVYWISDKAEFTPKSIQTKDERANKVYAIKVRVENDGTYKIGMYGEVKFNSSSNE